MIILDTNVISEFAKPLTSERVAGWLRAQSSMELSTTTITEAELFAGVAALPEGKRRTSMARAYGEILDSLGNRIFLFDRQAAREFSLVVTLRRQAGLKTATADGQIAAIARLHGAAVATRNVDDFGACGVQVINPWIDGP
ncbi:MAG: type II toxin-antitoxin system VapC family toxin [Rhizomicrobium sp.]